MNNTGGNLLSYNSTDINDPALIEYLKRINESEESRINCLESLRKALKDRKDLEPCLEEEFLLRFIRVAKFDSSKALQRVLKYYQQQDVLLDAFTNCSLSLEKAKSLNHFWISPYRLPNNSFLIIFTGKIDYRTFSFRERFYLEVLALNKALENPINQVCGVTVLYDYEGFDFQALLAHSPSNLWLFVETILYGLPLQTKAVHIMKAPRIFSIVFKIGYAFLSSKMKSRIHNHPNNDNWKSLHDMIPADVLPEEYGGKIKHESLINCLDDIEGLEDNFRNVFKNGFTKTKERRQSMEVLRLKG